MKKSLTLLFIVFSANIWAEDTITLVNHQVIVADIKSISSNEIIYKDPQMPDGPDFILQKQEISFITFRNGVTQTYNLLNEEVEEKSIEEKTANNHSDIEVKNGYTYASEDGKINMIYDFKDKKIYLLVDKPLMYQTIESRNIATVFFLFGDKKLYLAIDMVNKVEGVAILSGLHSFLNNIDFHRYFKKNMPKSFVIDIPYETRQVSYQMRLTSE